MTASGELVRLRYTGKQATIFSYPGIGEVEPGGEFEVPAGDAERFTRRRDIQLATASGKLKAAKAPG
jgi:hypothetical protein